MPKKVELCIPQTLFEQLQKAGSPHERLTIALREHFTNPEGLRFEDDPRGKPAFGEGVVVFQWQCPEDLSRKISRSANKSHVIAALRSYFARCGRILSSIAPAPKPIAPPPERTEVMFTIDVEEFRAVRALGGRIEDHIEEAIRNFSGKITSESEMVSHRFKGAATTWEGMISANVANRLPGGPSYEMGAYIRSALREYMSRQGKGAKL